jgi:predicted Zn-ribbon and HTH transcriptional regulator
MITNNDVDVNDLPESEVDGQNICRRPYCQNRFVIRVTGQENTERGRDRSNGEGHLECARCGHVWKSRSAKPSKCPHCGSYQWNKPAYRMECMKCRHVWNSSSAEGPRRCPSCRSYDWKIPTKPEDSVFRPDPNEDTLKIWICREYEDGMDIIKIASKYNLPVMKVMALIKRYYDLDTVPRL